MNKLEQAKQFIKKRGGMVKTAEAKKAGIHPTYLYKLLELGAIERVSRGIFRLRDMPSISRPDIVVVAMRAPKAVICLISALSFYEITTQIPHSVDVALLRGSKKPRIDYPPVSIHYYSPEAYETGIEKINIDGVPVRIYNVEKTIADCFKFRNQVGLDVALEALKTYRDEMKMNVDKLIEYADICRVTDIMKHYIKALYA